MRVGLKSVSRMAAAWTAEVAELVRGESSLSQGHLSHLSKGIASGAVPSSTSPAPKLLADLVEAVLGAVLLDCDAGGGAGLAMVWHVYSGIASAAGMYGVVEG